MLWAFILYHLLKVYTSTIPNKYCLSNWAYLNFGQEPMIVTLVMIYTYIYILFGKEWRFRIARNALPWNLNLLSSWYVCLPYIFYWSVHTKRILNPSTKNQTIEKVHTPAIHTRLVAIWFRFCLVNPFAIKLVSVVHI